MDIANPSCVLYNKITESILAETTQWKEGAYMFNYLPILWLAITVALVILETMTYQMVAIWFALGSLAALLAATAGLWGFQGQLTLFVVVSIAALIGTRPFVKKVLKTKKVPTNADRVIGKTAVVLQEISPIKKGRVRADGLDWSAISAEEIPVGAKVTIESMEGVTVYVRKKEN